jgi:hypothetical protein
MCLKLEVKPCFSMPHNQFTSTAIGFYSTGIPKAWAIDD